MAWESIRRGLLGISGGREVSAMVDQALVSGINFITNVILARVLGLHDYGIFALAWTTVLFANSLQWAFIVSPMMSVGPKQEPEDRPLYYGSVLVQEIAFALICAVTVFVAVLGSAPYFPELDVCNFVPCVRSLCGTGRSPVGWLPQHLCNGALVIFSQWLRRSTMVRRRQESYVLRRTSSEWRISGFSVSTMSCRQRPRVACIAKG